MTLSGRSGYCFRQLLDIITPKSASHLVTYWATLLIRNRHPVGPYRRPIPRLLGESQGGGRFLMCEVPLYVY